MLPDNDPKNLNLFQIGSKLVVGDNPPFGTQKSLNPPLLDFRVFLLEAVGEPECYDWKTFNVVLWKCVTWSESVAFQQ